MKRTPSALAAIGGFGIAVATLSVTTTAAIVLLAPPPPALRTTAADAIAALRGPAQGFNRRITDRPPSGTRLTMLETLIAGEIGRPVPDVRVTWPDGTAKPGVRIEKASVPAVRPGGTAIVPQSFVLVQRGGHRFEMVTPNAASTAIRSVLIGLPMTAFTTSVRQADGRWLRVEPARPFLAGWQRNILIALAVSLLLLAPLAWVFARRLTRPFRALVRTLDGPQADRVPIEGPRELREAAAAIAGMRNRLAIEASERARMLTAIAHDLRTPLTGLRLRIEGVAEPQRSRMVADVDRMQAMIGDVLTFARDAAMPTAVIDVRPLLAEIVGEMTRPGAPIRLAPGPNARIAVSGIGFRRVVENLVANAIAYAGGGTITLRQVGDLVVLEVTDDGPGIPAAERERLLRPFERGEASRNRETGGAGLGFSIVQDFAARHGGDFALSDAPGGGTTATLRLPAARTVDPAS